MSMYPKSKSNLIVLRDYHQTAMGTRLAKLTEGIPSKTGTSEETKARRRELQAKREYQQATRETWE